MYYKETLCNEELPQEEGEYITDKGYLVIFFWDEGEPTWHHIDDEYPDPELDEKPTWWLKSVTVEEIVSSMTI